MSRMNRLMALFAGFWIAATAASARYDETENGGIIIFRALYAVSVDHGGCDTVVIITSAEEIKAMNARLESAEGPLTFRMKYSKVDMKLKPGSAERMTGYLKDGRRVLVVTRAYADKHNLIR